MDDLERLTEYLSGMSVEERIQKLDLNPDRADVILPAMIVLQMIAHEARISEVLIPGVGLKDGLLLEMARLAVGPNVSRRVQVMASVERMGQNTPTMPTMPPSLPGWQYACLTNHFHCTT
jgi:exopolyphosphatase/pppGpp-phosphohydrolase